MSSPSHNSNESEGTILKNILEKIAQDVQALLFRQLHHEAQLKERDAQFALMQDDLKMVKYEYTKSKKSSHTSSSRGNESYGNKVLGSMNIINHPLGELEKKIKKALERLG